MNTYTIDLAYNSPSWRTAVVRAENLDDAIELAYNAEELEYDPEDDNLVALDSQQPGVVCCDDWDGGLGECGPTFVTCIAQGHARIDDLPGRAFQVEGGPKIAVPDLHSHFWTEWPQEAAELERLREENLRLRGLAQLTLDDIEAFDAQTSAEEYTNTEEAWVIMRKLAALARTLLAAPQPARVPA